MCACVCVYVCVCVRACYMNAQAVKPADYNERQAYARSVQEAHHVIMCKQQNTDGFTWAWVAVQAPQKP